MSDGPPGAPAPAHRRSGEHPLAAVAYVLGAMVIFSTQDTLSKILVADYSPFQVAWGRYVVNAALLIPFLLRAKGPIRLVTRAPALQAARGIAVTGSAVLFMAALGQLPIADATAINFVSPLVVTALSIPLLGEKVGVRRWSAVAVGFAGAMIIIRPGGLGVGWAAALPLLSASLWALGLVLTRRIGNRDPALVTLALSTAVAVVALSAVMPLVWRPLSARALIILGAMGAISVLGQYAMILGYLRRPASVLAPLAYSQMIWSTVAGALVFGAVPGAFTWIGGAVVGASGLYVLHRERVVGARAGPRGGG